MNDTGNNRVKLRAALALLAAALLCFRASKARPASGDIVAVFDIESSGLRLGEATRRRLTALLVNKIAARGYRVVSDDRLRSKLRQQKRDSYKACHDRACQIELGRELAAQRSLSAKVLRLDDRCMVALTLYDLKSAATDGAGDAEGACTVSGLVRSLEKAVLRLGSTDRPATSTTLVASEGPAVANFGYLEIKDETSDSSNDAAPLVPLNHTAVEASIVGVMSSVRVTQRFENTSSKPLEAVYVFPLPHRAAVHAMSMRIGDRRIEARIAKRNEAARAYNRAKLQGRTAALLEQQRANVFTQSVANIMPGDEIEVQLDYVEELVPRAGQYQFVFPMVVGPRYTGGAKDGSRINPPLLARGMRPGRDISLVLEIDGMLPLRGLRSLTHTVSIRKRDRRRGARVVLSPTDAIPNRDFVLGYRLADSRPQVAALAGAGHVLLMVQPKAHTTTADLAPKEYVFVVDTSGSMKGLPLARAKQAMQLCLDAMRPIDRFQVIRFATSARTMANVAVASTPQNIRRARQFLSQMDSGGGTDFLPALELALRQRRDPRRARVIAFFTDGYIGNDATILRFINENLSRGTTVFAIGIGSSVNRSLLDGMSRLGNGLSFVLLNQRPARRLIRRFFAAVSQPVLTGLTVDWGQLPVRDLTPGRLPDLYADRPLVIAGRFSGVDHLAPGSVVTLRGALGGARYEKKVPLELLPASEPRRAAALGRLWARRRIAELMDRHAIYPAQRSRIEGNITDIGLRYSLMSRFTSFVAVDSERRNNGLHAARVDVPSPRPASSSGGASNSRTRTLVAQAALSTDQLVPGDPEVSVRAPADAVKVTLLFPSGEIKACSYDAEADRWLASFLVAEGTPDGVYAIRVLITLASGEQIERQVRYQVDGSAPRFLARLDQAHVRPAATVTLSVVPASLRSDAPPRAALNDIGDRTFDARVTQDISTVVARLPSGRSVELKKQEAAGGSSWCVRFEAPARPGKHAVVVVVRDKAGNKARRQLDLSVR